MTIDPVEGARLARGAEALVEEGDSQAWRLAGWIAFAVMKSCGSELSAADQMRLARAAGRAAEHRGASLAVLAKRVIDPVLRASAGGGDLDVGDVEDLNFLRERINIYLSRHSIRV